MRVGRGGRDVCCGGGGEERERERVVISAPSILKPSPQVVACFIYRRISISISLRI